MGETGQWFPKGVLRLSQACLHNGGKCWGRSDWLFMVLEMDLWSLGRGKMLSIGIAYFWSVNMYKFCEFLFYHEFIIFFNHKYLRIYNVALYKAEELFKRLSTMWGTKIIRLISHGKSLKVNSIRVLDNMLWDIRECVITYSWENQGNFSRGVIFELNLDAHNLNLWR